VSAPRPGFIVAFALALLVAFSGCASYDETLCAPGKRLIRDGGQWTCSTFYGTTTRGDHKPRWGV
jgi:hypothetical protein